MKAPQPPMRAGRGAPTSFWHLLACIRWDEVAVLQGAPFIGALFAMPDFSARSIFVLSLLIAGNVCLVAHVFVLNDWAGIEGDMQDPHRAARNYVARGESSIRMGLLAVALLILGLALFVLVNRQALVLACVVAALSGVYSLPIPHGKGVPLLSTVLHVGGGAVHFLLGYASFREVSGAAVGIAAYFALVFAAGHLTHETRDHVGDLRNRIRTNAVAFGPRRAFQAGLIMFSMAYLLLVLLAWAGVVPMLLLASILLYPVHLCAARRAWREELSYGSVRRLQGVYRWTHAAIGLAMLASVPPWFNG